MRQRGNASRNGHVVETVGNEGSERSGRARELRHSTQASCCCPNNSGCTGPSAQLVICFVILAYVVAVVHARDDELHVSPAKRRIAPHYYPGRDERTMAHSTLIVHASCMFHHVVPPPRGQAATESRLELWQQRASKRHGRSGATRATPLVHQIRSQPQARTQRSRVQAHASSIMQSQAGIRRELCMFTRRTRPEAGVRGSSDLGAHPPPQPQLECGATRDGNS